MSEKIIENVLEKSDSKNHEIKDRTYYGIPYPKIYLQVLRVSCPYCNKRGRAKVYKNFSFDLTQRGSTEDHIINAFQRGEADLLGGIVYNDLQAIAFDLYPELGAIAQEVEDILKRPVLLSGSGSTLFSVFDPAASRERADTLLAAAGRYRGLWSIGMECPDDA